VIAIGMYGINELESVALHFEGWCVEGRKAVLLSSRCTLPNVEDRLFQAGVHDQVEPHLSC
jgi:hypothetical protein